MSHKVLGYSLLTLGISLIFIAAISVFMVFTKRAEPISLFEIDSISIDPTKLTPQAPSIPSQIQVGGQTIDLPFESNSQESAKDNEIEIFPGKALSNSMNIIIHLFFMGFIASIGSRFATIGTQLIRPIVIKAKTIKQPASDIPEIP